MQPRDDLHSISHEESDANVNDCKYGKGITKRPTDDVPELKHPLRAREEEDALGQGGLFLRDANGTLKLLVARGEQTAEGEHPGTEAGLAQPHHGSLERRPLGGSAVVSNEASPEALMIWSSSKLGECFRISAALHVGA